MKCPPNLVLVRAHGANFYKDISTEKQLHVNNLISYEGLIYA